MSSEDVFLPHNLVAWYASLTPRGRRRLKRWRAVPGRKAMPCPPGWLTQP